MESEYIYRTDSNSRLECGYHIVILVGWIEIVDRKCRWEGILLFNVKIACWDGKTLGNRNILLAVYKCSESLGVMCLHWLNYNGALNSEDFLCYNLDGKINLMNLKLLVPQQMIRD